VAALTDEPYRIDIDSIRRAFPPGIEAPPLLLDFAGWLDGRPWGSVGCFSLVGDFSDSAPIVDGSPLRDQFALFARLPEGSVVGCWYGIGGRAANAPIVVLGSEGQHEIIAATLEGLLAKIAVQRFERDEEWTDFTPHEDAEDATDELADWLTERLGGKELEFLAGPPTGLPDFGRWMAKWCSDREEFWAAHPTMVELAHHLAAHRPAGKTPWDTTRFEVAMAGSQYQVRVLRRGRQPIEEAAAIEPLLRGLRDERWRAQNNLGLWFSMYFTMSADGRILPSFDYETRPMIGETPADLAEARADLRRAPRPSRWIPAWLTSA
jgi:hypothetical protein